MKKTIISAIVLIAASFSQAHAACSYVYGDASVTYMTPKGDPVVYRQEKCNGQYKKTYFDLNGKVWSKGSLVPSSRHQLNEAIEALSGNYDIDINADLDSTIYQIAVDRGILQE